MTAAEDPEYPPTWTTCQGAGCEAVHWNYKTDCKRANLALCEQDMEIELTRRILRDARDCGSDICRRVACRSARSTGHAPGCVAKKYGDWRHLPIIT